MHNASKFAVIAAFTLITTVSFFNYVSQNSLGSRAIPPAPPVPLNLVHVGFDKKELTVYQDLVADIDIFMNSDAPISAATITLTYDPQVVEYVYQQAADYASITCMQTLKLKTSVRIDDNPRKGILSITRVAITGNEHLPQGKFCFGTAQFNAKHDSQMTIATKIVLDRTIGAWEAAGPMGHGYQIVTSPDSNVLMLSVSPPCPYKRKGDANCDNTVNLIDFEIWRRTYMRTNITGTAADFNLDGKTDLLDFELWRQGYFSFISITPTPSCTPMPPCMLPGANPMCMVKTPQGGWCPTVPSPTCTPRPLCLDTEPRCLLPEPATGWCIDPTPISIDECFWCGTQCLNGSPPPNITCPAVAPDPNTSCRSVNGGCTVVRNTPTPYR